LSEEITQIDGPDGATRYARQLEHRNAGARIANLDFDLFVIELVGAKTFAESLSCCRRGIFAYQRIEHAFFRRLFSARPNFPALVFANKGKSHLDEIANDGLHVTPDVA